MQGCARILVQLNQSIRVNAPALQCVRGLLMLCQLEDPLAELEEEEDPPEEVQELYEDPRDLVPAPGPPVDTCSACDSLSDSGSESGSDSPVDITEPESDDIRSLEPRVPLGWPPVQHIKAPPLHSEPLAAAENRIMQKGRRRKAGAGKKGLAEYKVVYTRKHVMPPPFGCDKVPSNPNPNPNLPCTGFEPRHQRLREKRLPNLPPLTGVY